MSDMQAWDAVSTPVLLVWSIGAASAVVMVALRWLWERRTARGRRPHQGIGSASAAAVADGAWDQLLRVELTYLSDVDLCWAWRASYRALSESNDVTWRRRVVQVRQAYLAELERRHPVETARWLETHPQPGDGPERFLRAPRTDGHEAA